MFDNHCEINRIFLKNCLWIRVTDNWRVFLTDISTERWLHLLLIIVWNRNFGLFLIQNISLSERSFNWKDSIKGYSWYQKVTEIILKLLLFDTKFTKIYLWFSAQNTWIVFKVWNNCNLTSNENQFLLALNWVPDRCVGSFKIRPHVST